jgi:hypothetical protein
MQGGAVGVHDLEMPLILGRRVFDWRSLIR